MGNPHKRQKKRNKGKKSPQKSKSNRTDANICVVEQLPENCTSSVAKTLIAKSTEVTETDMAQPSTSAKCTNYKMTTQSTKDHVPTENCLVELFERTLNTSTLNESTPLYPLLREWMAHKLGTYPKRNEFLQTPPPRQDNGEEILAQLKSGALKDVFVLPAPKPATLPKIPPQPKPTVSSNFHDLINQSTKATKEELLSEHLKRWKLVKKNWIDHTKRYNERFESSFAIIKHLFNP